ncbi:hypothetical protein DSM07_01325 [Oenococcus sp. UCMA 16435]|nr:hypothetical protein DSM07_01325 [Oenococcus sp. UCMA 16435]MDI4584081.1 hypothetical protein [Oenococcus sp. UCMA 14587]
MSNNNIGKYDILKYELIQTSGTIHIQTPNNAANFTEVKKYVIEQTPELTQMISFYPSGLIVFTEQTSHRIETRTNVPLKKLSDSEYEVEFPDDFDK